MKMNTHWKDAQKVNAQMNKGLKNEKMTRKEISAC